MTHSALGPRPIPEPTQPQTRAQHESIRRSPVLELEPVGLVNMWGHHLDPNGFRHRITWPVDDYLQVTCVYLHMLNLHNGLTLLPGSDTPTLSTIPEDT